MKLLILDGNSLINRAFYGIKLLSTKDGLYTNALYGFLSIYQKLLEMTGADHVAAAFDLSAPTFRHKTYEAYKAGRKKMPEELAQQLPILKELLLLLGCTVVEKEGYEADDILGTLSAAAAEQGGMCSIATGDRDALQLVGDRVTVLLAATKMGRPETTVYDVAAIREKYGLEPTQLIDLKALMGDSSDNIPGVPGVGEKTALDLMHRFGSLDTLYAELENADLRDSLKQKLSAGKESAYLSQKLGAICRTAPVDTAMEAYRLRPYRREELAKLLTRLEFFKLMEKLELNTPTADDTAQDAAAAPPVFTVLDGTKAMAAIKQAAAAGRLDLLAEVEKERLTGLWVATASVICR